MGALPLDGRLGPVPLDGPGPRVPCFRPLGPKSRLFGHSDFSNSGEGDEKLRHIPGFWTFAGFGLFQRPPF